MRSMGIKKVLAIAIPVMLIVTVIVLVYWHPSPFLSSRSYPPPQTGPVTEYSSIKELEEWVGVRIPTPSYLPVGYEIKGIYQIGPKPKQEEIPAYFYLLYSDEEVNYGEVTSFDGLLKVLENIGKPGGCKLMLLLDRHTQKWTTENIKNNTQGYVKWLKEEERADAELIHINDMPAALERKSDYYTIVWMTPEWTFWLSGYHPGIAPDELIKIAESVR